MKKIFIACVGIALLAFLSFIVHMKYTEHHYPVQVLSAIKIMDKKPNLAIELLNDAEEEMSHRSEKERMRYELLRVEAHDKNFDLQESDSLMKEIVAYYDKHGNRNERMAAYYYMGSCYRDLGENPLALEWYFKAYQMADTASRHFDKNKYLAIYDQLTLVLADENNFKEELMWYKKMLNDFPEFMDDARTLHNIGEAYAHNNIIDTAAFFYNKSFENMKKYDEWNKELFFGVNIQTAFFMAMGDWENVKRRLPFFRYGVSKEDSGIDYYNYATYHDKNGYADTALYHYRNALKGKDLDVKKICYQRLYQLFKRMGQQDSANWYAESYMKISDSLARSSEEERTLRISKQYAYQHKQKELAELRAKNLEFYNWLLALALGLTVTAGTCTVLWLRFKKQREKVMRQSLMIAQQEEEHQRLVERMKDLERKANERMGERSGELEKLLQKLHALAGRNMQLELADWKKLVEFFDTAYPKQAEYLGCGGNGKLSHNGEQLCVLTCFGFDSQEINSLLNISRQNAYNLRMRISQQLTGQKLGRMEDFSAWIQEVVNREETAV